MAHLSQGVFDLLIIGGGIYGLFAAWDAAARGLSVALVEKGDFGHGTSSNTLRVIHGGLRYLQHGDVLRMRQSIRERTNLMRIAPHLIHPMPFLLPTYGHSLRGKQALTLALKVHDLVGFDRNRLDDPQKHLPASRAISKQECLRLFRGVAAKGLTGGVIYYDCQMYDSERLMLAIARRADAAGAELANYVRATELLQEGSRVVGALAQDILVGDEMQIRARVVMFTGGPWTDHAWGLLKNLRPDRNLHFSKAFNLFVDRQFVPEYAVGVYGTGGFYGGDDTAGKGSRMYFITPWRGHSLIGTAHLPYGGDPDNLEVTDREVRSFLHEINKAYPGANLDLGDVRRVYQGLLPVDGYRGDEVHLTKRHQIRGYSKAEGLEGLISVLGVKFTESRHVAEKAIDLVFRKLGKSPPRCVTAITPVHGGQIERFDDFLDQTLRTRPKGLQSESIKNLVYRYGSSYPEVLEYLDDDSRLGEDVASAEVLHSVRKEMAQTLSDVVFRRTSAGLTGDMDQERLKAWANLMAQELGWDRTRTQTELDTLGYPSARSAVAM